MSKRVQPAPRVTPQQRADSGRSRASAGHGGEATPTTKQAGSAHNNGDEDDQASGAPGDFDSEDDDARVQREVDETTRALEEDRAQLMQELRAANQRSEDADKRTDAMMQIMQQVQLQLASMQQQQQQMQLQMQLQMQPQRQGAVVSQQQAHQPAVGAGAARALNADQPARGQAAAGDQSPPGDQLVRAPSSSSGAPTGGEIRRRRERQIIEPARLTYDKASDTRALESWLFDMEQMFEQMDLERAPSRDADRLREARLSMDRDLNTWWAGHVDQAAAKGVRVDTWLNFVEAVRAQFASSSMAREATSALLNIRQAAGESIPAYFQRVYQLVGRAQGSVPDLAVMQLVLDHVRRDEWSESYGVALRAVEKKEVTTLAQLRELLQLEAVIEQSRKHRGGHSSHSGARPQPSLSHSGARPSNKGPAAKAARVAAISAKDEDSDNETFEGEQQSAQVAAVRQQQGGNAQSNRRCARCKKTGHAPRDCPEPEDRSCFVCGEEGHIASACPEKKMSKKSSVQSKNGQAR